VILPGATLGLLGGGQLGRMFTSAARTLGYRVTVVDPDPIAPAAEFATAHLKAPYADPGALDELARTCAAVTTEFENAPAEALDALGSRLVVRPAGSSVAVAQDRRREKGFFASGDSAIAPDSLPILAKIAVVVQSLPNQVRLEGHTDARPIHTSRFASNWELSAARSIAMLELLRDRFQIPPSRMAIAGYAENSPADTNDTEEGRAHNRRVDLVLLSAGALTAEPTTNATPPAGPAHR